MISTPVLVNTTNRKINELQPVTVGRNFVTSSSSSNNSDSDGNNKIIAKNRPWVDDEKAKRYREQFKQRKEEDEKRRASIDIIEIQPELDKSIITVQVPPPRLKSENIDVFGKNEDSLIDFEPEPLSRHKNSSITTRPISGLENLKMDNFTDDLLKTFNQLSNSDTTSTYDNHTLNKKPQNTTKSSTSASHELLNNFTPKPVPTPRNLSSESATPVPKPRTNWVQFD